MNALAAADLDTVRATVRTYLEERAPMAVLRRAAGHGPLWTALTAELGLSGIAVPEEYGGQGCDFAGPAVVLEELGRALTPVPYLSSAVLATQLLLLAGSLAARRSWLPRLATGSVTAAVALVDDRADWALADPPFELARSGGELVGTGRASYVTDVAGADILLLVGRDGNRRLLGLVATDDPGLTVRASASLDQTRPLSEVELHAAPVEVIGEGPGLGRAVDVATVGLAAEQLGGAQRVLDLSVAHAGGRQQFDRAIGSFQSIKHPLADLLVDIEAAGAAVRHAVGLVGAGSDTELAGATSVAKSAISDAYWDATRLAVQVHGAMGFTWEHDLHLYLRRAMVSRELFGSAPWHRERLAATLLDRESGA